MKKMKKLAVLAMSGLMALSVAIPAMASDYQITINDSVNGTVQTKDHTMKAYQLFSGKISDGKLVEISWGKGFDGDAVLNALKADTTIGAKFADATDASSAAKAIGLLTSADELKVLNDILANQTKTNGIQNNGNLIDVEEPGYYFIQDESTGITPLSDYILQVLGETTITIKADKPKVVKKIMDGETLVDANTTKIGETVYYQINSSIPDTTAYNKEYYYFLQDTLSDGLTYGAIDDVWVDMNANGKFDEGDVALYEYDSESASLAKYKVYEDGQTIKIAFTNVLALGKATDEAGALLYAGKDIVVNYHATINENAVIGNTGNPNEVDLTYSNDPKYDYEFNNDKPGLPKEDETSKPPVGTTPKDTVISYVTELNLTKYADSKADDHLLAGAEFTLTGYAYKTVYKEKNVFVVDNEDGRYYLLKDGTYTTTAPTENDIVSMIAAADDDTDGYVVATEADPEADTDVTVDGIRYRVVKAGEKPTHIRHTEKNNASYYADTTTKYSLTTEETTDLVTYPVEIKATTGEDGKIKFEGLDAGTYKLVETVVPAGYNKCDDIEFVISATVPTEVASVSDTCEWASNNPEIVLNGTKGIFNAEIIDKSGATLPETGGVGTTMFYVFGSVLVAAAGVLLITKRRMIAK